jgi:prevent-host-death family protein
MNNSVSLKEFRQDVAKYAGRVAKGETFIVTKRSQPLFRIEPVEEEGWETVVDFTQFRKGGISATELLKILESV